MAGNKKMPLMIGEIRDSLNSELVARRAWGEWLSGFEWNHFATLTFTYQPRSEVAVREFRRWVRRLEQRAQRRINWFFVLERGSAGPPAPACSRWGNRNVSASVPSGKLGRMEHPMLQPISLAKARPNMSLSA